jgi:hypothetical protein
MHTTMSLFAHSPETEETLTLPEQTFEQQVPPSVQETPPAEQRAVSAVAPHMVLVSVNSTQRSLTECIW